MPKTTKEIMIMFETYNEDDYDIDEYNSIISSQLWFSQSEVDVLLDDKSVKDNAHLNEVVDAREKYWNDRFEQLKKDLRYLIGEYVTSYEIGFFKKYDELFAQYGLEKNKASLLSQDNREPSSKPNNIKGKGD